MRTQDGIAASESIPGALPAANLTIALIIVERWIDYRAPLIEAGTACVIASLLLAPLAVRGVFILRQTRVMS